MIQYLATKYNVPAHKIYVIGLGKDKPVETNKTSAGRADNRRVDVRLMTNTVGGGNQPAAPDRWQAIRPRCNEQVYPPPRRTSPTRPLIASPERPVFFALNKHSNLRQRRWVPPAARAENEADSRDPAVLFPHVPSYLEPSLVRRRIRGIALGLSRDGFRCFHIHTGGA